MWCYKEGAPAELVFGELTVVTYYLQVGKPKALRNIGAGRLETSQAGNYRTASAAERGEDNTWGSKNKF